MGRIHFIGGEKGGVGKSMTARLLAQYLIDRERIFIGFDMDESHATLSRFYQEYTSPVSVDDWSSLDHMIEVAEQNPQLELIVDLAAQTAPRLERWINDCDALEIFQQLGVTPYLWHVMDDGVDSMNLMARTLDTYGQDFLHFVIVQNMGRAEDFSHFSQSSMFRQASKRLTHFVTLPRLDAKLAQKIDFSNLSFWAAANSLQSIGLVERKRVKVWLQRNYEQFDRFLQPVD